MERIVKAGQYCYDVSYRYDQEAIIIDSIHAVCELILFDRAMPILFEISDRIKLTDAKNLSVDMEGKLFLFDVVVDELAKAQKPNLSMQATA